MVIANTAAEAAMLGLYLANADAWTRWPTIRDDYTDPAHVAVYLACAALVARGHETTLATVPTETERQGVHPVPISVVAQLREDAPASGYGILADLRAARARRVLRVAAQVFAQAADDPTADPALVLEEQTERAFREIRSGAAADAPVLADHEAAWRAGLDARDTAPRVRSPWADVNRYVEQFPRGELTIIAARPGVGKSAMAAQLGAENAKHGRHVLFCSAEMTSRQVIERLKSAQTGIALERVRRGASLWSTSEASALAQPLPAMRLTDRAGMTTQMVTDIAGRVAAQKPLDLLLVDHLHHLSDRLERGESRYEQIGRMVNRLKTLAKQLDCACIVLCQLNRQAADSVPTMAHLRDAGTIEEFANTILLLHRPEGQDVESGMLPVCEVRIEKQRNGPTGLVKLQWDGIHTQFRGLDIREDAA